MTLLKCSAHICKTDDCGGGGCVLMGICKEIRKCDGFDTEGIHTHSYSSLYLYNMFDTRNLGGNIVRVPLAFKTYHLIWFRADICVLQKRSCG